MPPPKGWRRLLVPFTHRVSGKIIGPYLVIVILLAVLATYVVMNLVTTSLEERFRSQLADSGRAANESMINIEAEHLRALRQMAFTEGVAEELRAGWSEQLRAALSPVAVNSGIKYVDVLDQQGELVLALRPTQSLSAATGFVDRAAREWAPVKNVLEGRQDGRGDKFAAVVAAPWGNMLYVAGPVKLGQEQVGVIAVGTPLEQVTQRLSQEAMTGVTFYGADGAPLTSTLPGATSLPPIEPDVYRRLANGENEVFQRPISLGSSRYMEMLGVLELRGRPAMVMGVNQSISLIADKGAETRNQMLVIFGVVILSVLVVGVVLVRVLLRPIKLLVAACKAVAAGDLSQQVPVVSADETGVLTVNFTNRCKDCASAIVPGTPSAAT